MKKLNIKALFINHFEKMIFGMFGLIVLVVLAKTTWGRYPDTPEQLMQNVKKVKDSISSPENAWPDAAAYKIVDYSEQARMLFSPIAIDRYDFSIPLFFPLHQIDEPRREPIFEPVQSLTAKAGLVTLSIRVGPDPATTTDDADSAAPDNAPTTEDPEFKVRASATGGPLAGGPGATATSAAEQNAMRGGRGVGLFGKRKREEEEDMGHAGSPMMGMGASPSPMAAGVSARGVRVVSVRGVFPLKKQLENYARALHITEAEAARGFEIADFVLERQKAQRGPHPWKNSEWETVNIESAASVLLEASEIDREDPVPVAMKDIVITMDLPARLIGVWGDFATHERIKDELLKEEDLKNQNLLLDSLDQTANESKLNVGAKSTRRGLAAIQTDVRGMVGQVRSNQQVNQRMAKNLGNARQRFGMPGARGGANDEMDAMANKEFDRLFTSKSYLLFRYLDFDVQSDYAYRYRVRLKIRNPNYGIAPELLGGADPAIANGPERDSPLSNISDAAVVPSTVNYFLEDVGRDPYREEKIRFSESNAVAQLSVFDWDTSFGTVVATDPSAPLKILTIGGMVGDDKVEEKKDDKKKENKPEPREETRGSKSKDGKDGKEAKKPLKKNELKILDLTQGGIVTKKYFFQTLDVLLDVEPDAEIDPADHKDLKFAMEKTQSGTSKVKLLEEALIATSLGELKALDNGRQSSEKDRWRDRVNKERAHYKEVSTADDVAKDSAFAGSGNRPRQRGRRFRQRAMR